MERNILITSLSSISDRQKHSYYRFEEKGRIQYCDGLSVAEAGAKYLLSSVAIDTIIAVGGPHACHPDEAVDETALKEWTAFSSDSTGSLSEYGFFQYRISQFLNGLDLEAVDVLEDIDPARRSELMAGYQNLLSILSRDNPGARPDRVFHLLAGSEDHAKLMREAFGDLSEHDFLWIKRYMYTQLNTSMKLSSREDSENLKICFVQMRRGGQKDYVPAQNVSELVAKLKELEADRLNIYMDMQGLESTEGYMILGVLSMLGEDVHNPVSFREIITTSDVPGSFVSLIDNDEKKRYEINRLVSGMSAFIRYGKVDEILRYWNSTGIHNRHIDLILYAMKKIDEGVSLCNISDLESGIRLLKRTLNDLSETDGSSLEIGIFRILENTIRMDYGALLEEGDLDELELVRWALQKKFYQQAVTIVESRIPQDIIQRRVFYYAKDDESLKAFTRALNEVYWETLPKDRWGFKDIDHYFIKLYGRSSVPFVKDADRERQYTDLRMKTLKETGEEQPLAQAYSVIEEKPELLDELLYTYYRIGSVRNQISHAENGTETDPEAMGENEHLRILVDAVQAFINAYDAVRAYMKEQGLSPEQPPTVDPERFKNYTFNHRPSRRKLAMAEKKARDNAAAGQSAAKGNEPDRQPKGTRMDSDHSSGVHITINITH